MTRDIEPTARSRAQLTWTDSAGSHAVELVSAKTAGSAASCELVVTDKAVSRIHFELDPRPDGLWVLDLASRNGVFVNGVKVVDARAPAGSTIRVGTTDITVAYGPAVSGEIGIPALGTLESRAPRMREVFATLAMAAKTDTAIVLEGEGGAGKRALARAVHDGSTHAGGPFIVIECAALPPGAEAERLLDEARAAADGGTLVLDDPAELSLGAQRELCAKLEARPFRLLATTQVDLRKLVNQGAFREDLYFRLAGIHVRVPPVRERSGDVIPLLERFLGDKAQLLTEQIRGELEKQPWLGNLHELRVHAERMLAGDGDRIPEVDDSREPRAEGELTTLDVPTIQTILGSTTGPVSAAAEIGRMLPIALEPWFLIGFKEFRERWIELGEREYLRRLMLRTNRSSSTASREAGLERTYLYRLIKKHGI